MRDTIVVDFPSRPWALAAIDDLRAEGCTAELLDGGGVGGTWRLRVEGPVELIDLIRFELHVPSLRVCWETFVNEAVAH